MGEFNKQTKINKQMANGNTDGSVAAGITFSSVAEAKNYYYTAKEQAVFDKWCDNIQWALANDDQDGNATWLKVTFDFDAIGKADSWHAELDTLSGELAAHCAGLANIATHSITVEDSEDHLY